jgi:tetratricopeptide (TPR) repeat protein
MVKKILCLFLVACATASAAVTDRETFDEALRSYAEGDYEAARQGLESLVNAGSLDPAVFLNLGHADYRLGRVVPAAINYRRSLALDPSNTAARSSLEHVFGELGVPASQLSFVETVGQHISFDLLVLLGSLMFWAGLLLVVFAVFSGRRRGLAVLGVLVALLGATAVAISWAGDSRIALAQTAMLTENTAALGAPAANAQKLTDLGKTQVVRIIAERDGWTLVRLPIGVDGWVRSELLEPVFPGALSEKQ